MTSYRTQIKDAIKAQLTGKTIAGAQIFTSLDRQLDPENDLPAILVYTQDSRRGPEDFGKSVTPRVVTITLEAATLGQALSEMDAAEAFADQIEVAMEGDRTLGKLVENCVWQHTMTDVTSHGSREIGVCLLEYQVTMLTNPVAAGAWEYHDDGFTEPPHHVQTVPNVVPPPGSLPPDDSLCGPDGCDIPAWAGEVQP